MNLEDLRVRNASIEIPPEEFKKIGYQLVDQMASFLATLPDRPVTSSETPVEIRKYLGKKTLPENGVPLDSLIEDTFDLLVEHSLFNGHPRFWGYITSSAAPIGAFGDFMAAMVNPNVGGWLLAPIASEIELQTIQWIAEMLGYPTDCGGLFLSGGNVANFVCFMAARNSKVYWDVRKLGVVQEDNNRLVIYCSEETHAWIEKAVDQYGLGTDSVRWIETDDNLQMNTNALRKQIIEDKKSGFFPLMVIGTAGTTGVGVVDDLPEIAEVCKEFDLWFHVDAAYGGFAACLPDASPELLGLREADSVVIDPHKWLYSPLEAGVALVRNPEHLRAAFSHHQPSYYKFDQNPEEMPIHYLDYGPQNSRGFRALKVWLALKQVGRSGYVQMISDDIRLAKELYRLVDEHPNLEALTQNLSITTFRFVPEGLTGDTPEVGTYLNELNVEILTRLQEEGEVFLSNAVIHGKYALRVCVVNFRTSLKDIEALIEVVNRVGIDVDERLRSKYFMS